jgi:hypothetical protein
VFAQPSPSFSQIEIEVPDIDDESQETILTGNVVNSTYLIITDHRYRDGDFTDHITGTVVNNSTEEVSGITVTAALYDSSDRLITTAGGGYADVSTLPPGDNSAFSITLSGGEENVDHYTLFPGGTP